MWVRGGEMFEWRRRAGGESVAGKMGIWKERETEKIKLWQNLFSRANSNKKCNLKNESEWLDEKVGFKERCVWMSGGGGGGECDMRGKKANREERETEDFHLPHSHLSSREKRNYLWGTERWMWDSGARAECWEIQFGVCVGASGFYWRPAAARCLT